MTFNKFELPKDYISFMKGLEDKELSSNNGYIELFPLNELDEINTEYEIEKLLPNFITIGTNGGGTGIFFNKENKKIYSIPFVGMEETDAILLANSFSEFIYKFENEDLEII
ncbi:SMI1/KNR4 family protein [Chryseobacterium sp. JUb7]|uniref:SMI1/KNR4 family protein n=1 Tax=Chryseobacterium sp. JUb7 TaxID=2940599 RepID=UPI002168E919|nr:SMI1/KNR4 family protein [Chryseobacterium sp. JUb7]MCS3533020.1 hypothetical protein [Chryseobacterium sp. JUb7]